MDILNNQILISLSMPTLIIIGIIFLIFSAVLIYLAVKLRRVTHLQPKYGFLGKSLYPVVTIMLLGIGSTMAIISINNDKIFELRAQKQVQTEIFTYTLTADGPTYLVDLKAVPTVEGKIWGKEGDKFDIYWTLEGIKDYSFVELAKSNEERSGIQDYILPGNYKITVTIIYEEAIYTFSKEATF